MALLPFQRICLQAQFTDNIEINLKFTVENSSPITLNRP